MVPGSVVQAKISNLKSQIPNRSRDVTRVVLRSFCSPALRLARLRDGVCTLNILLAVQRAASLSFVERSLDERNLVGQYIVSALCAGRPGDEKLINSRGHMSSFPQMNFGKTSYNSNLTSQISHLISPFILHRSPTVPAVAHSFPPGIARVLTKSRQFLCRRY